MPNRHTGKRTDWGFWVAGKAGYARGREGFEAPAELTIEASPWRLLRAARMSDNARNLARVGAAIERLRAPVKAGSKELPPLIATVRRLDNGKGRRFVINPEWLPRVIGRAALPLPTTGDCRVVLALYLFLCSIDTRPSADAITVKALCARIGIRLSYPSQRKEELKKALARVNDHLEDERVFDPIAMAAENLPLRYRATWLPGERVRFEAIYEPGEEEASARAADISKARKEGRTRRSKDPLKAAGVDEEELREHQEMATETIEEFMMRGYHDARQPMRPSPSSERVEEERLKERRAEWDRQRQERDERCMRALRRGSKPVEDEEEETGVMARLRRQLNRPVA